MYQSPIKAIEELVVNAYDAEPVGSWYSTIASIVFDDGRGTDQQGIQDLWHVGHSSKRDEHIERARGRRQIGKFGIGKLATAAVANRVAFVTKSRGAAGTEIFTTTVSYESMDPKTPVPTHAKHVSPRSEY